MSLFRVLRFRRCTLPSSVIATLMLLGAMCGAAAAAPADTTVDLAHAVIVIPPDNSVAELAADMLADEVEKRSNIRWTSQSSLPANPGPVIRIETMDAPDLAAPPVPLAVPDKTEGFAIWVDNTPQSPTIHLCGRDNRGALFAVGRLIRLLDYAPGGVTIDASLRLATAPHANIRGHQLSYGDMTNAYDAWDMAMYEQYIRELVIFGANSIEFSTDLDHSKAQKPGKNMKESTWDRSAKVSQLLSDYGLNCWVYQSIPEDKAIGDPGVAELRLQQFREMLASLTGLDTLFVPGGDGGLTPAPILMPFLEQLKPILLELHPGAQLWVSNQTFEFEENDIFFAYLSEGRAPWLDGLVYGPWTKMDPFEMRTRTPSQYPIRFYADITHNVRCQFPVPDWDRALAHGLNREAPNPRPADMHHIYTKYAPAMSDFLVYSEGVNDDLNKFVWSALGWDPETPLDGILREYGKVFFGAAEADAVAQGLKMLEQNWRGPIAENTAIASTLEHWKGIAERGKNATRPNWRLQMYLIRAYYDAYMQRNAAAAAAHERDAVAALARASQDGAKAAIDAARAAFDQPPTNDEYRARIEQLAADLFESIGMQLSVRAPYFAMNPERGALLDTLDTPLNDRLWFENQFEDILALTDANEQVARIDALIHWEDAGPGGFYDDLGNAQRQPHLVHQLAWAEDPGYVNSPQCEFSFAIDKATLKGDGRKLSWLDQASTLYKCPLRMHYDGLDPDAQYTLRVMYAGRFRSSMRLLAEGITVHDWLPQPEELAPVTFDIPRDVTRDGILDLEWNVPLEKERAMWHHSVNRGCQVAEVWLIKK